jgi:LysM repeat protein
MTKRAIWVSVGLSLALVAAAIAGPWSLAQAAPAQQSAGYITVVVKDGESLANYARLYGVSGYALLKANPQIKDANLVYPGETIVIPVVKSFTPSLTTPFYYTVQPGDNVYAIARSFQMDASVIAWANSLNNYIVILGATYLIPPGPHFHIVQKGETLESIAAALPGMTMSQLQTYNDIPNPYGLLIGQYVYIPVIFDAQPLAFNANVTIAPTATPLSGALAPAAVPAVPIPTNTPLPTAVPNTAPVAGNYIQIAVKDGENLATYTYRYGVTGGALLAANPQLKDPNKIYAGEIINVPVVASFTPSRTTPFFYVVQPGDTLASVAAKFEMIADWVAPANPGVTVTPGATILIPAGPHVYTVKVGDQLRYIAPLYGTTVDFILKGNDLPNPDKIYTGEPIFIPIRYGAAPMPYTP